MLFVWSFIHFSRKENPHLDNAKRMKIAMKTYLHGVVLRDDVGHVEYDLGGRLQDLHLHLHVAEDAEVAVD